LLFPHAALAKDQYEHSPTGPTAANTAKPIDPVFYYTPKLPAHTTEDERGYHGGDVVPGTWISPDPRGMIIGEVE
jgi:hypothetical protein